MANERRIVGFGRRSDLGPTGRRDAVIGLKPIHDPRRNGRELMVSEQAGMRLRRVPSRPDWKPLFSARSGGVESWAKFLDDAPALAPA